MDVRMARRREAGQWLYRQKKYEAALKCFDAVGSHCYHHRAQLTRK